ncbi:MAG: hypothetical protein COA58_00135 [Bacteroidetes bacterium]|nr:MAG: hypothetical protein COA58_00135 [Bacteroidota bacterium]
MAAIYFPKFLCPLNELDGAWFFSQAPSVLQGGGMFNYFTNFHTPAFYGWLQIPFATHLTSISGVHLFYFTFSLLLIYTLASRIDSTHLFLSIPLLILTDKVILLQRPEPVILILALVLYQLWNTMLNRKWYWGVAISVFLCSLHIPPGLLAVAAVFCYEGWLIQRDRRYVYLGIGGIILLLSFYLLFPENIFISTLEFRLTHFTVKTPLTFLAYSGVTLVALLTIIRKFITKKFIVNYLILLAFALVLGAYYYLLLLFIPPLLIILYNPKKLPQLKWLFIPIAFNLVVNVIHPLYTHIENSEYCMQVNEIIEKTSKLETEYLSHSEIPHFFIENNIAPASFIQGTNCRMLLFEPDKLQIFDKMVSGDKIAITTSQKLKQFQNYAHQNNLSILQPNEVLHPVEGKLSLQSLYTQRTDSLGLWILTVL